MTHYQRRYKVARALQMIAESDCKVSDDNVSDIYDDDDSIASPDVASEIENHVSDTIRKNQTTTMYIHWIPSSNRIVVGKQEERRPGETEKEEEEDE